MNNRALDLGGVIKKKHMQTYYALLYNLRTGTKLFVRQNLRADTREHSGELEAESKKNKRGEVQPVLDSEDIVLHYIRHAQDYQQKSVAKFLAHTSVPEEITHLCASEVS